MKKRLLALLVACAMIVSLLPVQVLAYDGADSFVQTQAEEVEPEAGEVTDQSEAEEEESEAEEDQSEAAEESSEAEKSESEANMDQSEADKSESEADEEQSEAEEDQSEADEDSSEDKEDNSEADEDNSDAAEPGEPEQPEAEPDAASAEEPLTPQDGGIDPFEAYCNAHEVTIDIDEDDGISRFVSDRFTDDNGTDDESDDWQRLDCYPGEDFFTVTVDGDEFSLTDYDEMDNMADAIREKLVANGCDLGDNEFHLWWESNEAKNSPWGVGEHTATLCLGTDGHQVRQNYTVQVINIKSMEVADFDLPISSERVNDENWDENPNNGKLDCWPNNLKVVIEDGSDDEKTFGYDACDGDGFDDFREELDEAYPGLRHDWDWTSSENPENPAKVGDTLNCTFFLCGWDEKAAEYKVSVTDPSPFDLDGCSVGAVKRYENDRHDRRVNCGIRESDNVEVKVTLTKDPDGEELKNPLVLTGDTLWAVEEELREAGYNISLDWDTDEDPEQNDEDPEQNNVWAYNDGKEHKARLCAELHDYGDYRVTLYEYDVTVLKPLNLDVESLSAEDTYVWTNSGEEREDDDETWYEYDGNPRTVTLVLNDADNDADKTRFEGNLGEVEDKLNEYLKDQDKDSPGIALFWDSEQWEHHWVKGKNENAAWLSLGGNRIGNNAYNVWVVDHPFQSVEVQPIVRFSETDREETTSTIGEVDDEQEVTWDRVMCWPEKVTVNLDYGLTYWDDENGGWTDTFTGTPDEVEEWLEEEFNFDANFCWDSAETCQIVGEKWVGTWGNSVYENGAWLYLDDYWDEDEENGGNKPRHCYPFNVTVAENPIESVTVHVPDGGLPVYETHWRWHPDDEDDDENQSRWKELDCWPHNITVQVKDGPTLTGDPGEVREQFVAWAETERPDLLPLPDEDNWNWGYESQQHFKNNEWHHKEAHGGDKFQARFQFLGVESALYTVNVISSPIESLTVDPITRYESDREEDRDENDEPWQRLNVTPDTITVTANGGNDGEESQMKSGNVYEVEDWLKRNYGYGDFGEWDGTRMDWTSDETSDEPWTHDGGDNHDGVYTEGATLSFGGTKAKYDVTVLADPTIELVSVEGEAKTIYRFVDNREWHTSFRRVDCNPTHIKLKVGETVYEAEDLYQLCEKVEEATGAPLRLDWDSAEGPGEENSGNWTKTDGTPYTAWLTLNGEKLDGSEYTVKLVDATAVLSLENVNQNTEIKVAETFRFWEDGGEDEDGFWRLDCYPGKLIIKATPAGADPVTVEDDDYDRLNDKLENALREKYPGIFAWVECHSNETPKEQRETEGPHKGDFVGSWTAGHTYSFKPRDPETQYAWLDVCGRWQPYAVTVIAEPALTIDSIEGEGNTIYRFLTDTYQHEEDGNSYNRIDCWPNNIHATLTLNGTEYKLNAEDLDDLSGQIQDKLGAQVKLGWDSDERRGEGDKGTWTTAGRHENEAWILLNDEKIEGSEYTVVLLDPNDENIFQVALPENLTVKRAESDRVEEWNDALEDDWLRVRCDPGTITVSAGQWSLEIDDLGRLSVDLASHLQENYPGLRTWIRWENNEKPKAVRETEGPYAGKYVGDWTVGNTYDCWLNVCGRDAGHYSVQLQNSPIKAVSVNPVQVYDTDRYHSRNWDDSQDRDVDWFRLDIFPHEVTVTLNDGNDTKVKGRLDVPSEDSESLESKLQDKLPDFNPADFGMAWGSYERCDENGAFRESEPAWEAGNYKNGAWFRIFGMETKFDVEVVKNPVVKVEVPAQTVEDTDRNRDEEGFLKCAPDENDEIKVWLDTEDSEPITGYWRWDENDVPDENNIYEKLRSVLNTRYPNAHFWMRWDTEEDPEDESGRWTHGSYEAWLVICGKRDNGEENPFTYRVHVTNTDHTLSPVAAVKATCTAAGNIAYYLCNECQKYFADAEGRQEIYDVVDPAKGHTLTHMAAQAAQEGVAGNIEYWHCTECGKYFRDAAGTQEITQAQTVIEALPQPQPEPQPQPQPQPQPEPQPEPQPQPPAPTALTAANVSVAAGTYVYDGKAKTPAVTVTLNGQTLTEGTDYTLSYSNNVNAGTATVTVTGTGSYEGTAAGSFAIAKAAPTITANDLVKTVSKTVKYKLSVKAPGKLSFKSSNPKLVMVDNKGNVTLAKAKTMFTAKITITSAETANFRKGRKTVVVMIGPAAVKMKSAAKGKAKQSIDVAWNKGAKGVTGYQVQYALDGKFTKEVKTAKVSGLAKVQTTLKKLKSGKQYYIRVRTLKGTFYSPWSDIKTAKAK